MDQQMIQVHLTIGRIYGKEATCGNKINYHKERNADKAAEAMMKKGSKKLEAYPCPFCYGWHIGRALTTEELLAASDED